MPTGIPFFLPLIEKILDIAAADPKDSSPLVELLALSCLLCIILGRTAKSERLSAKEEPLLDPGGSTAAPLQKTLTDLLKTVSASGGSPASNTSGVAGLGNNPDLLGTLLPLLSNPQLKAKMTPTNMAAIFGLLNSLGGSEDRPKKEEKPAKKEAPDNPSDSAASTTEQ
ncbi:MAG: hypothetical protein E6713_13345 [Sporomusaceae bacterium]|nr:hypothetical protein [Sporomusaceae bacterium]